MCIQIIYNRRCKLWQKTRFYFFHILANKDYEYEITRENFLFEFHRFDRGDITLDELDPFIICRNIDKSLLEGTIGFITEYERRTLNFQNIKLVTKSTYDSKTLTKISPNTYIEIVENQYLSKDKNGFLKIKYKDYIGWIAKNNVCEDKHEPIYYKKNHSRIFKIYSIHLFR